MQKAHYNIHNTSVYCNGLFSNPDLVQAPFLIKTSKVFVLCAYITQFIHKVNKLSTKFKVVSCKKGKIPSFLREHILPDVSYFLLILSTNLLIGFQYLMRYIIHLLQSLYLPGFCERFCCILHSSCCYIIVTFF